MNMKTFIFAAALLQAAKATQQHAPTPPIDDTFEDMEEYEELGLSVEELIQASSAHNINQRGYFRSDAYQEGLTAEEKLDKLWELLVPNPSYHETPVKELMWKEFDNFFVQRANGPFCDSSDELRFRRKKTTHTQGLVAKIEWKPVIENGETRFSGIYGEGTQTAIIRLSETKNLTSQSEGLHPAFAVKFLIDHHKSENLFAMPNMTGKYKDAQGEEYSSWDFFHGTFKSRVERPEDKCFIDALEAKFLEGNNRPYSTSVTRPAYWTTRTVEEDGTVTEHPHRKPNTKQDLKDYDTYQFPFQLEYEGVYNFPDNRDVDWYDRLRDHFNTQCQEDAAKPGHCIEGVPLIDVYAWTAPDEQNDLNGNPRERVKIATIKLNTKLYTSEAGDNRLFFQHIRVNKDYRAFPNQWKRRNSKELDFTRPRQEADFEALRDLTKEDHNDGNWPWPADDIDAEEKYLELLNSDHGCPFSWLFNDWQP